jgi:SAM-dependent methyltransferase
VVPLDGDLEFRPYYADPERYEAEVAPFRADLAFYTRRALELGGPVLELGCGTGRVLVALAEAGLDAEGLDHAPRMLERAAARLEALPTELAARVRIHRAEMTDFRLARRFPVVLAPLNTLMHLGDDQAVVACLACAAAHLTPGGRLLFDLSLPREELTADTREAPLRDLVLGGLPYRQFEDHRHDPATRLSRIRYTFVPLGGQGRAFRTELVLRMLPPEEVPGLLARAGLRVLARHGDFRQTPPGPDDVMQLWEAGLEPGGPLDGRRPVELEPKKPGSGSVP